MSIPKVSPARRAMNALYRDQSADWLAKPEHWMCAVPGCKDFANEIHHQRGRTGKLLTNQAYWIPVCRPCHIRIHDHPKWAMETTVYPGTPRAMPLLASGRSWNTSPPKL